MQALVDAGNGQMKDLFDDDKWKALFLSFAPKPCWCYVTDYNLVFSFIFWSHWFTSSLTIETTHILFSGFFYNIIHLYQLISNYVGLSRPLQYLWSHRKLARELEAALSRVLFFSRVFWFPEHLLSARVLTVLRKANLQITKLNCKLIFSLVSVNLHGPLETERIYFISATPVLSVVISLYVLITCCMRKFSLVARVNQCELRPAANSFNIRRDVTQQNAGVGNAGATASEATFVRYISSTQIERWEYSTDKGIWAVV